MGATTYPKRGDKVLFKVRRRRKDRSWIDRLLALAGLSKKGPFPTDITLALG
jgi:hypothetical protein